MESVDQAAERGRFRWLNVEARVLLAVGTAGSYSVYFDHHERYVAAHVTTSGHKTEDPGHDTLRSAKAACERHHATGNW